MRGGLTMKDRKVSSIDDQQYHFGMRLFAMMTHFGLRAICWPRMGLWSWTGMVTGRKKCSGTQINLSCDEKHLQTIVTFLKVYMFPKEVIEVVPAFCRDCELLPKWRFVVIIRNYDQLDSLPSTVCRYPYTHVILFWAVNVELVKQPLCKHPEKNNEV